MRQLLVLAAALLSMGCAQTPVVKSQPVAANMTYSDQTVHLEGVRDVRFGTKKSDLSHKINNQLVGCHPQLTGMPESSLVFAADETLVLLWFSSPLRTPEGIGTGSTVEAVRKAYPQAVEMKAPPKTYRFDGLAVTSGDRGFLFLHDGSTVQKAIAGHSTYLDRLFKSGFGVC